MKKLILLLLIIISIPFMACGKKDKKKEDSNKIQVKSIDTKSGEAVIESYMKYVIRKNEIGMASFYSKEFSGSLKEMPKTEEPHPVGFKIEESKGSGDKAEVTVHLFSAYTGKPYYSDDTFKYSLKLEDEKVVIDKISKEEGQEVTESSKKIMMKTGKTQMEKTILSMDNLPEYVVPEDAALPEQKFPVPKEGFGPLALSPDGKQIVVTTTGKNAFLSIAKVEEKEAQTNAQGKEKGGGGGGGGEKKEGGEGEGEQKKPEEKKENITIIPVDFFVGGQIKQIAYSPKGKNFVVEYLPTAGLESIAVYSSTGKKVKLKIEEKFKPDKFSIKSPFFIEDEEVYFIVAPAPDATDEEKKLSGEWMFNIKTMKWTKLNS